MYNACGIKSVYRWICCTWIDTYENVCGTWKDDIEFCVGKMASVNAWPTMPLYICLCGLSVIVCVCMHAVDVWLYVHMSISIRMGSWDGWMCSPRKRTCITSAFPFYLLYPGNKNTFVSSSGWKHGVTFQNGHFKLMQGGCSQIKIAMCRWSRADRAWTASFSYKTSH